MIERDGEKRNKEREWDEEEMLHRKRTEMENENIDLYLVSGFLLSPWQGEHADVFLFASLSLNSRLYASALFCFSSSSRDL